MTNPILYETPFGTITIPKLDNIGISFSGGADSAILLYCLIKAGMNPTIFFLQTYNSKISAAQDCLDFINNHFNTSHKLTVIKHDSMEHNIRPAIINLASNVDYLYTAVTQNPTAYFEGLPPTRPKPSNETSKFIMPFLHHDKRATIYLYKLLNVNELLDLSYTCTENSEIPCNKCFACNEKRWAIGEVNL